MAVLTCTQTTPTNLRRYLATPGSTALVSTVGSFTVDASAITNTEMLLDAAQVDNEAIPSGTLTFTLGPIAVAVGAHTVQSGAWTSAQTPHIFSATANITVVQGPADADGWSVTRYMNFLAGNSTTMSDVTGTTLRAAACQWAGVSIVDFTTVGALNMRAGNTGRQLWVDMTTALNLIAYGVTSVRQLRDLKYLNDQDALYKIATA